MARFVLVHGAFCGAWSWERVIDGLRAAGHDASAIDLPGSGADATPVAEVTLDAFGERVCAALNRTPPTPAAVLVGHSMGGMAITQAAARRPDLVAGLIYAAAFLPVEGESLIDLTRRPEAGEDQVQANLVVSGDPPVATMSPEAARQAVCQLATDEQAAWAAERRGPQPVLPFTQPLRIDSAAGFAALPRAYVVTLQDRAIWPDLQRFMAARAGCDPVVEIDTDHSVWLTAPDELVAVLLSVAPALLERRSVVENGAMKGGCPGGTNPHHPRASVEAGDVSPAIWEKSPTPPAQPWGEGYRAQRAWSGSPSSPAVER